MLYFIVPYTVMALVDSLTFLFFGEDGSIPYIESYGIIGISALLLYVILFRLVIAPKTVFPKAEIKVYKTSSLNR